MALALGVTPAFAAPTLDTDPTNDDFTGADVVTIPSFEGEVSWPSDNYDFFKFNLPPGTRFTLLVESLGPQSGAYYYVFDPAHLLGNNVDFSSSIDDLNNLYGNGYLTGAVPDSGMLGLRVEGGRIDDNQEGYRITLVEAQHVPVAPAIIPLTGIGLAALAGLRLRQRRRKAKKTAG
ncbi:MAG: hypothetical protein KDG50_13100 [Chromatiales bacterium]|nr:hypothetical protein [Chromatiales bacterium]